MEQPWWKKSVVYQIYPKSFYDTSGNGVGDLKGIVEKLSYLQKLGVEVIWLTPIYQSPQRDNGYDISDYYAIHEEFGSMEDFEYLVQEAHKVQIRIIMDIVVNHTSTEHEWFKKSRLSIDHPYRDFYIWKDPVEGRNPSNWKSKFGGSAWEYDDETEQFYLHLFDKTQADLNWENERVRKKLYEMMTYWFEKGVDGFRLDVINLISKHQEFPDDDGFAPPGDGRRFYTDGPRVHEFMHEMNKNVFSKYNAMTVGEMSSTTIEHCIEYTKPENEELSMTFNFHHLKVDYPNGEKWAVADFDFLRLKNILSTWQVEMNRGGGWNALFWCNHDQPRIVSRFGNDGVYRKESAKMLATTIHMMQGTPYIYQGEEIGMANPKFSYIEEYRDVESLNMYEHFKGKGMPDEKIISILKEKSRDNSRTPVQWNSTRNAGFTQGEPWIGVGEDYEKVNVENALEDPDSIFYHYQALIALRKKYEIITTGSFKQLAANHSEVFSYIREEKEEMLLVVNNFYGKETLFKLPREVNIEGYKKEIVLSNYQDSQADPYEINLRPYESIVYYLKK
ncbi:alpha,alpha-phosphotrehalase [Bacillus spongiae]|uniref:Alpha,alpha-phosphotrehalase n=1 Tax=Bacillus spongiae TaxID=2683610 RepID=A0ABU8HG24_9BACI